MSNDLQKYENWRAITESDFVTMFIKTWFAFVATLRELYPQDNIENIIGKGDSVFLKPYLREFENKYLAFINYESIKTNILRVYSLGRQYVINNGKYNRFFYEDFYALNEKYKAKKETDNFSCTIRYSGDGVITVNVVIKIDKYKLNKIPLILKSKTDISDILNLKGIATPDRYREDESSYLNDFYEIVKKRVTGQFLDSFNNGNYNNKYNSKDYLELEFLCKQDVYMALNNFFSKTTIDAASENELLYYQVPCINFIYKTDNSLSVPVIQVYEWFLKFVYFLRNALFHEIIDPLDLFWQDIFKQAYLALKEILDSNINFLKTWDQVKGLIYYRAWDEFRKKPEIYIPNFNEYWDNGDIEINLMNYTVNNTTIDLLANISLDYWFDEHTIKRVDSRCRAQLLLKNLDCVKFNMKKVS